MKKRLLAVLAYMFLGICMIEFAPQLAFLWLVGLIIFLAIGIMTLPE